LSKVIIEKKYIFVQTKSLQKFARKTKETAQLLKTFLKVKKKKLRQKRTHP